MCRPSSLAVSVHVSSEMKRVNSAAAREQIGAEDTGIKA